MSTKPTNAQQFVADLGAGTFANQLGAAISMVSQGAVQHNKKGKRAEDTTSKTPMHLNAGGDVTLFANHTSQLFTEDA